MKPRSVNEGDKYIGRRIRMRRMELGINQVSLGEALGVSFQQVQKYEKGVNRVGADRLQQIARFLDRPIDFFMKADGRGAPDDESSASVMDGFMATRDGVIIAQAFVRIADADVRRTIANFVDKLSRSRDSGLLQIAAE